MSLLSCNKNECENILCDTYIEGIGHICNECITDFKKHLEKNELSPNKYQSIMRELRFYMCLPKQKNDFPITVDEFFKQNAIQYQ